MMSAPSSANRTACERPWARAAPVMNATFPSNSPAMRDHTTAACSRAMSAMSECRQSQPTPGGAAVASTELDKTDGVDVEDVPSAAWGWSKENHRAIQIGGILSAVFLL